MESVGSSKVFTFIDHLYHITWHYTLLSSHRNIYQGQFEHLSIGQLLSLEVRTGFMLNYTPSMCKHMNERSSDYESTLHLFEQITFRSVFAS